MSRPAPKLSHLDEANHPAMVDVGGKAVTRRTARAQAIVVLPPELAALLRDGEIPTAKGPVFQTAILAGVMGAKRTPELIPLCHPIGLDDCRIAIEVRALADGSAEAVIHCRVSCEARTGAEMEALTGASVAALTLYDMGKAVSHAIVIREIRLLEKTGGKSDYKSAGA
jgi:cyclic pyranopterin monophosphate synthase